MLSSRLKIWLMAIRPKTLPAGIAPVLLGTAMAVGDGVYDLPSAMLALFGALTIQIGTNLANDYFDFQKGADTAERIGPVRVTQAGLLDPLAVLSAAVLFFGFAVLIGSLLIIRAGWPVAVIGVLSIVCGLLYTAGPWALGYLGLGEIFVFIFFGPVAVAGTYYVQSFEMNAAVILAGIGPGLLSAAILAVNNLRDIATDRESGKKTLAVRFGRSFAQGEYFFCIVLAMLMPVFIFLFINDHQEILLSSATLLLAFPAIRTMFTRIDGPSLNHALALTGRLLLIYCILFGVGWISLDYLTLNRIIQTLKHSFL